MTTFSAHKCSITDKWQYNEMQVVWMENEFIKIGVLPGRGADIFEFRYKPANVNLLLRLPGEIKNPRQTFAQLRDTPNQAEDYYYGGWQDCLPNSTPVNYRGASWGQHGEVWGIPWNYSIMENSPEKVTLKCWVRPMRTPLLVEKTLTITNKSAQLNIQTRVMNESNVTFDLMWGQHIAFGLPLLKEGAHIHTNAKKMVSDPNMPDHRRFKPEVVTEWPEAVNIDGGKDDASYIPEDESQPYSEMCYLWGFEDEGNYQIVNEEKGIGFGLKWDASLFEYLWLWQERYATKDAPWWGNTYAVALEPWTAKSSTNPGEEIKKGNRLKLGPGSSIETSLQAYPVDTSSKDIKTNDS
jgi:galactose mutarotase-like enzyme